MIKSIIAAIAFSACAAPPTVNLAMPAETLPEDAANEAIVVAAINDAVGCAVVTISKSATAVALAQNTFVFAYTLANENTLFASNDTGFFQPSTNSILLFPTVDMHGPNGEPWGDEMTQRSVAHELGHALGLMHTTTPGAIMNPDVEKAPFAAALPEFVNELRTLAGVSCPSK